MHENGRFTIIRQDAVADAHPAVRAFIEAFFAKRDVLGVPCYVAFGALSLSCSHRESGVAPCHSVDVRGFGMRHGLPSDQSLDDVLCELARDPQRGFHFYTSWNNGCIGPEPD